MESSYIKFSSFFFAKKKNGIKFGCKAQLYEEWITLSNR